MDPVRLTELWNEIGGEKMDMEEWYLWERMIIILGKEMRRLKDRIETEEPEHFDSLKKLTPTPIDRFTRFSGEPRGMEGLREVFAQIVRKILEETEG
jgi:hypothetical protein